jgi:hypothetical protein
MVVKLRIVFKRKLVWMSKVWMNKGLNVQIVDIANADKHF